MPEPNTQPTSQQRLDTPPSSQEKEQNDPFSEQTTPSIPADFNLEQVILGTDRDVPGTVQPSQQATGSSNPDGRNTQPTSSPEGSTSQDSGNDNDKVRYQYWQSQADKLKNENERLREQLSQIVDKVVHNEDDKETEKEPEFPPPPAPPQVPAGFNREDAMNNPDSPSAQYVRD